MHKISVIIPVYNAEKYLDRCLSSISKQSYKDYEIILINDGSTDGSNTICEAWQKKKDNIKVIHKDNGGSASARNIGISIAQGEYIAFIDADDFVHDKYLEILINNSIEYETDISVCGYISLNEDIINDRNFELKQEKVEILDNITSLEMFCSRKFYTQMVVVWNKLIKKELFDEVSFVEGKCVDDEFVIHKLFYKAKKIAYSNLKLYYYIQSENSQMRKTLNINKFDSIEAIEQQLLFFEEKKLKSLYNKLLYRYCRISMEYYYLLKKYFPKERKKILEMKKRRKMTFKALKVKEITFLEKMALLINYFPIRALK